MRVIRCVSIGMFLLFAAMAVPVFAQTATINGTVLDQTKLPLPGATVTVTEVSKGTTSAVVSDERGNYRLLQLTPGVYKLQAELQGFASVIVEKIDLQVGQNATLPISMGIATVNETLTVTGESPLVDVTSSQVSGNVNRTQMDAVPLLGRNWLELAKMVPGMTANVMSTTSPGVSANNWAMNLDGQQVANKTSQGLGQPKFSREAIAEYQIVTNLYDVTQGRSTGVQLQAITKSGTNTVSGSTYGFFRDSKMNAVDAVSGTVLPYKDQQYGGTIGGPIVKDKMHYFFSIEPERTPATIFDTVQALGQSFSIPDNVTTNSMLLRVDNQLAKNDRLSVRVTYSHFLDPHNLAAGVHPSQEAIATQGSMNLLGTWSKVLSANAVQEVKIGLKHYTFSYDPSIPNQSSSFTGLVPEYDFPGLTVGPIYWMPQWHAQNFGNFRYDLNLHRSSHDFKIGGEFLDAHMWDDYWNNARGTMTFTSLPSDIASRIPATAQYDPSQWNLSGLVAQRFNIAIPRTNFTWTTPDPEFAFWIGDTWKVKSNLTINYGVRYDNFWDQASVPGVTTNSIQLNQFTTSATPSTFAPGMTPGDFGYKSGIHDNKDVGPQAGFAWNVGQGNDFVIHGGSGLYYTVFEKSITKVQVLTSNLISAQFNNSTNSPTFVTNPTGGINTYAQASTLNLPQGGAVVSSNLKSPETWQSGLGFSKQLGRATGITADMVYRKTLHELATITPNLLYDPTTGYNVNPSKAVANPAVGQITYATSDGKGDYAALQTSLNQRLTSKLQGGASYTLMFLYTDTSTKANNPFDYVNGEYATSTNFQRNTLRGWATYELPFQASVSATYSYGSGNRYGATISTNPYGGTVTNRLNLASGGGASTAITVPAAVLDRWEGPAVIASGVVIPRDALEGTPFSRLDLRLSKTVNLGPKVRASVIAELFNVLNHANYTGFNTSLNPTSATTTARFGQPTSADIPREGQLGFKISF